MREFKYTTDTVKDCINDTEKNLRRLIVDILSDKYGKNWYKGEFGWSQEKVISFEERRRENQKKNSTKTISEDLIDYTYLLNLKEIIIKNWLLFNPVFKSKSQFEVFIDVLNDIRNAEMHSRCDVHEHERHLCLGVCGEILSAINRWKDGYRIGISKYIFQFSFLSEIRNQDVKLSEIKARDMAHRWLEDIASRVKGTLDEKEGSGELPSYLFRTNGHHLTVKLNYQRNTSCGIIVNLCLASDNLEVLSKIIEISDYPYRSLGFDLAENLDIDNIVNRIKKTRTISSSVFCDNVCTNFDCALGKVEKDTVRASFSASKIHLIFDGSYEAGFFRAHDYLLIDKILSILYGELTPQQTSKILEDSMAKYM